MIAEEAWMDKLRQLDDLAMEYEVAVIPLFAEDYLREFYDFYRIRNRDAKLIPSDGGFDETLRSVSGEYRWEAIAEMAKRLFGLPLRVTVFDDDTDAALRDELGGRRGLSPFFFVFDMMFCEYGEHTLCFMAGSNN